MKQLEPVRAEVNLIYRCPKCENEHWLCVAETRFPAKILCYCGEKLYVKPVQTAVVTPHYMEYVENHKELFTDYERQAFKTLRQMGFSMLEIKELYKAATAAHTLDKKANTESIIKCLLQQQKTN